MYVLLSLQYLITKCHCAAKKVSKCKFQIHGSITRYYGGKDGQLESTHTKSTKLTARV